MTREGDLISRQATIEAFQMFRGYEANRTNAEWVDRIETVVKKLPSVKPQVSCGDAVSRQAALDAMYELCNTRETLEENPWRDNPHIDAITDAINNLPSVKPQLTKEEQALLQKWRDNRGISIEDFEDAMNALQEPKTGHWMIVHRKGIYTHLVCDKCLSNAPYDCRTNYCPNCGAKMVEPQESEES